MTLIEQSYIYKYYGQTVKLLTKKYLSKYIQFQKCSKDYSFRHNTVVETIFV